jgi:hypothetical protein
MNEDIESEKKFRDHHRKAVEKLLKAKPRLKHYSLSEAYLLFFAGLHKKIADSEPDKTKTIDERFSAAVDALEPFLPKLFQPRASTNAALSLNDYDNR